MNKVERIVGLSEVFITGRKHKIKIQIYFMVCNLNKKWSI